MKKENQKVEKLCGFYVSQWHLVTMILPYVNHKIEEGTKIITFLENNIEENIKTLVKKLNLKNEKEILKIRWTNINTQKYSNIEEILKKEIDNNKQNIILVNGCKQYIEKNNEAIKKWTYKTQKQKIKIINFFEVTEFNHNIIDILNTHDRILNTSGEKEISEVFEGYTRQEKAN